jgi:hypothetical protein
VVYQWSLNDQALAELETDLVVPDGMSREEMVRAARQLAHGHLAVFEHAGTSYISWTTGDELIAINEAIQALSGKGVERLSEVRSVQPLLDQSAVAAGFATLAGVGSEMWSLAPPRIVRDLTGLLNATPNRAQTPLFLRYRASAEQSTVAEYTFTVPREFTQDAATLAALVFTEMETE